MTKRMESQNILVCFTNLRHDSKTDLSEFDYGDSALIDFFLSIGKLEKSKSEVFCYELYSVLLYDVAANDQILYLK